MEQSRLSFHGTKAHAFTLVELIATIAILATIVALSLPYLANYVATARQRADEQALLVLNDAINRYKTQGGAPVALTTGKPFSHLLTTLKTPVNWNGLTHQFLRSSENLPNATTIAATGSGRSYRLTTFNSHQAEAGTQTDLVYTPNDITLLGSNAFNICNNSNASWSNSLTNPGGTNVCLVVGITTYTYSQVFNSLTYGGVPMTLVDVTTAYDHGGRAAIYVLPNPPAGNNTLSANYGATVAVYSSLVAAFFDNVDPSSPVRAFARTDSTGSHTTRTTTLASAEGDLCVDALLKNLGTASVSQAGQTLVNSIEGASNCADAYMSSKPGTESVTMGWTLSVANTKPAHFVISLRRAP